jgi:hypothetical protein
MKPSRSRAHTPALLNSTYSARLRCVLQADLRALTIPPHATLPIDPALAAGVQRQSGRLGDYLYAHGLITESALAAALTEQHQRIAEERPIALGDLLVEQGLLTTHALLIVLMLQQLDHQSGVIADTTLRLGELLVQAGLISADQLETALLVQAEARQRGENLRLGQVLIAAGALTHTDLVTTLAHQQTGATEQRDEQLVKSTAYNAPAL